MATDARPRHVMRGGGSPPADGPVHEVVEARTASLGDGMEVRRLLPRRARRRVGAWCFLDHFGPVPSARLDVAPHPHIGLQTVTWLLEGEVTHLDTLGSRQTIRPGQLNWMTAGEGIAHVEVSQGGPLHGVQLWVALPEAHRHVAPAFEHHAYLPRVVQDDVGVTVLAGTFAGHTSPARTYSPLLGLHLDVPARAATRLTLDPTHEHALLVVSGAVSAVGATLRPGALHYLGRGRDHLDLSGVEDGRAMLLGGAPMAEDVLLWWNFVARTGDEVAEARRRWAAGGFGPVPGYDGDPLEAPPL
ncbi:MAG: pirin family protein [Myxococcales bacterium]|nr:pirin family protein [Myxococcales bacterium]